MAIKSWRFGFARTALRPEKINSYRIFAEKPEWKRLLENLSVDSILKRTSKEIWQESVGYIPVAQETDALFQFVTTIFQSLDTKEIDILAESLNRTNGMQSLSTVVLSTSSVSHTAREGRGKSTRWLQEVGSVCPRISDTTPDAVLIPNPCFSVAMSVTCMCRLAWCLIYGNHVARNRRLPKSNSMWHSKTVSVSDNLHGRVPSLSSWYLRSHSLGRLSYLHPSFLM